MKEDIKKMISREDWRHQPWELRQMQALSLNSKKECQNRESRGGSRSLVMMCI